MSGTLNGAGILVTRPAAQAGPLAQMVRDAGGKPVLFPGLDVEAIAMDSALPGASGHFDLAIFVSPNAVRFGVPLIEASGGFGRFKRLAAIGPGTTAELKKHGVHDVISPQSGHDSEALIAALSGMQLTRALIVRGEGGRELLRDTLRERGATVEYLECYRRTRPAGDMHALTARAREAVTACVATSSSIVANLFEMAGEDGRPWLRSLVFFVPHPRVAATAYGCGAGTVFVTGNGDEALLSGMATWFSRLRPSH